ncbi:MAG TPA: peroxiredoxin-like family protein [Casimicrobiaceae bacterium]|nr:peroxiredoxin-like family protein [Casimicrobiaceae bacterium]
MARVLPRQPAPDLAIPTLSGTTWSLAGSVPQRFSLIVFYRGLHCPACKAYVSELDKLVPEFATRGVETIALSSDTEARAKQAYTSWTLSQLQVGHSLTIGMARAWGLYISAGRGMTSAGVEEPSLFSEPGVFLVRPDRTLYFAAIQSMPFARPHLRDFLAGLDFVISKDYPARGEA